MIRLAVIGADETRLQAIASRGHGDVTFETSIDECDAAVFLGPTQAGIAELLRTGKSVAVTLDAGLSKETLQALTGIASQAHAKFVVVNPERYLPSRQLIRQQLDAGKLGAPGLIRLHRWRAGAVLCDLDLILWYFGEPPNLVYAIEEGSITQVHLGFAAGGMALLGHAHGLPAGDTYCYLSVIGASGAAYADDHQNNQLVFRGGQAQALHVDEGDARWSSLVHDFVYVDPARPATSAAFPAWQQLLRVKDAVEKSLQTKQAVPLFSAEAPNPSP